MVTTNEILKAAQDLGKLVASHEAGRKYQQVLSGLLEDTDAQRLLNDYNRHLHTIGEKEATGKPIEVDDKRKLEDLQGRIIRHQLLRNLQIVQMDFADLMRKIDDAIAQSGPKVSDIAVASSPLANPDVPGTPPRPTGG